MKRRSINLFLARGKYQRTWTDSLQFLHCHDLNRFLQDETISIANNGHRNRFAIVEDFRLEWRRVRNSSRTGCALRMASICKWCEQAIIEWSQRVISILLLATTARSFARSQLELSDRNMIQVKILFEAVLVSAYFSKKSVVFTATS